jgi:hypothetical protein
MVAHSQQPMAMTVPRDMKWPATPPSGLDSACIMARPSVMAPSCLGVASNDAPTQL